MDINIIHTNSKAYTEITELSKIVFYGNSIPIHYSNATVLLRWRKLNRYHAVKPTPPSQIVLIQTLLFCKQI